MAKNRSILFVHKTFPGQFGGFAKYLVACGWDVRFLTLDKQAGKKDLAKQLPSLGVTVVAQAKPTIDKGHRYLHRLDDSVTLAETYKNAAMELARNGFEPDVVISHCGWGTGSFLPSVWPDATFVPFLEWWYRFPARDVPKSAARDRPVDRRSYAGIRNLTFMSDLQHAQAVICPTEFQALEFPRWLKGMTKIIHDGIDCALFSQGKPEIFNPEALGIPKGAPIVTYATRGMEPTRGFPNFMEAVSELQKLNDKAHVIIAGNDSVQYGANKKGTSFKEKCLAANEFDHDRLHFVGLLPLLEYRDLLRISDVHIYLSEPFVLSWSLVHSMAVECALVVSDNDMLREPLHNDGLAVFVDDKSPQDIALAVQKLLADPDRRKAMGTRARARALDAYDETSIHPQKEQFLLELLDEKING